MELIEIKILNKNIYFKITPGLIHLKFFEIIVCLNLKNFGFYLYFFGFNINYFKKILDFGFNFPFNHKIIFQKKLRITI